MKTPFRTCHVLLAAVILFTGCEREDAVETTTHQTDPELLKLAQRLNAKEIPLHELVVNDDNSRIADAQLQTVNFTDNSCCYHQENEGLPGCTTGIFQDPAFPYYSMLTHRFNVLHSKGPGNGLAEADTQLYAVYNLGVSGVNHELVSSTCYWTKYSLVPFYSSNKIYFDLRKIRIKSASVTLWYLKGTQWNYVSLPTGNHTLNIDKISQFQIRGASCNLFTQYKVDDIVVADVEEGV